MNTMLMKFTTLLALLCNLFLMLPLRADLSGVWTLDPARSTGLPPGMGQIMTITQKGDQLKLETKVVIEQDERIFTATLTADGREVDYTPLGPGGVKGKGRQTVIWATDGSVLEVKEKATFNLPQGPMTLVYEHKWTLTADCKTLKIKTSINGPLGPEIVERTFVKK
jgi:hypothetical protein